jgi:tripeptide aminopeptidase
MATPADITSSARGQAGAALQQEVSRLAAASAVKAALAWFHDHQPELTEHQLALTRIPAPPFGEAARAEWLQARFLEIGLQQVQVDEVGNVFGVRPGADAGKRGQYIAMTAHLDTVFPAGTPMEVRHDSGRLYGPGISDNGAGVTALLAVAHALHAAGLGTGHSLLFVGNVGEEGEGDVRGMRHIFADPRWRDSILYTLVIDGAGTDTIVTEALGSQRFLVTVRGPGGHSWSDFGSPNPIVILARAIEIFSRISIPASPKTTFNIGVISGGTSVNSIPEAASMRVDLRSASAEQVDRLERTLRAALEQALAQESRDGASARASGVTYEMQLIGSRPAAKLDAGSHLLAVIHAVDACLGNKARIQRASTDANIPISLGREALAIGAGGAGGGAHTLHEWYDPTGRELGLKRILLAVLTLAGLQP